MNVGMHRIKANSLVAKQIDNATWMSLEDEKGSILTIFFSDLEQAYELRDKITAELHAMEDALQEELLGHRRSG